MKWTEEQTIKFVNEYVKHECLYNVNSHNYGVKCSRNAALVKLSACMGIRDFGPKDAHHKLRSLKSTYSQELKKIKESAWSGHVYTPNVKWFKILHNAMMTVNSGKGTETSHAEPDYSHEVQETENDLAYEDRVHDEPINSDYPMKHDGDMNIKMIPRKRRLRNYNTPEDQNLGNVDKIMNESENEFDIFGKSIAAQLKNMPLDRAIEAQMFIQNYLSDMRLRALQNISYRRTRSTISRSDDEIV